jgi:hypothetical protein
MSEFGGGADVQQIRVIALVMITVLLGSVKMRHSPNYCVGRKSCISRHNPPMPFTETKMDDAYAWLCHRRRRFPPNADVWHLRFHWVR